MGRRIDISIDSSQIHAIAPRAHSSNSAFCSAAPRPSHTVRWSVFSVSVELSVNCPLNDPLPLNFDVTKGEFLNESSRSNCEVLLNESFSSIFGLAIGCESAAWRGDEKNFEP